MFMEVSQIITILLPKYKIFNTRFGPLRPVTIRMSLNGETGFYIVFLENSLGVTYKDVVKYCNSTLYNSKLALAQKFNTPINDDEVLRTGVYEKVFLNRELDPTSDLHPIVKEPFAIERRLLK